METHVQDSNTSIKVTKCTPRTPRKKKMENQRPKNQQIGSSKLNMKCKKHPNHEQSPGVCSMCLREKLSRLPATSTTKTYAVAAAASSSLSSLSSSNSSSYTSPVHRNGRVDLEAKGSVNFLKSGKKLLAKSRSMAFVPQRREGETIMDHGKKKKGFWSKLIRPGKKRMDKGLRHSRTMIERVSTRVH